MSRESRESGNTASGIEMYLGLRSMAMSVAPEEVGMPADADVFGVIMDSTYPSGSATLVAWADGSASLYTSTGGGVIGGGAHEQVAAASRQLVSVAQRHLADFQPGLQDELPPAGWTQITLRTRFGPRSVTAPEEDFGYGRHPASEVFYGVHAVITELRILEQGRDA